MGLEERSAVGSDYLALVTELAHSMRLAHPTAGVWEAADFQWWWRLDQHADPNGQRFWLDRGSPVAAVVLSDWGNRWQCDVLRVPDEHRAPSAAVLWESALRQLERLPAKDVELILADDDAELIDAVTAAGPTVPEEFDVTGWRDASAALAGGLAGGLPDGFRLVDRTELAAEGRPHHLARRNGQEIEERLRECSLYDPCLDLAICEPAGEVAAYALFWPDLVTGVGLVEPVRTEDGFHGRGLAAHLVRAGVDQLVKAGCTRCKVSFDPANEPAKRLYLGVGFVPESRTVTCWLR